MSVIHLDPAKPSRPGAGIADRAPSVYVEHPTGASGS